MDPGKHTWINGRTPPLIIDDDPYKGTRNLERILSRWESGGSGPGGSAFMKHRIRLAGLDDGVSRWEAIRAWIQFKAVAFKLRKMTD